MKHIKTQKQILEDLSPIGNFQEFDKISNALNKSKQNIKNTTITKQDLIAAIEKELDEISPKEREYLYQHGMCDAYGKVIELINKM